MFFYCIQWNPALCCFKQKTIRSKLFWGARVAQWWDALSSHQCGPGSNPGVDAICGLSLLLVLSFVPEGFSPGTPVLPSPQKPTLPNSNSIWNSRTHLNKFIWTLKGKKAIYNFFSLLHLPTDIPWRGGTRKIRKLWDRDIIEFKSHIRNS